MSNNKSINTNPDDIIKNKNNLNLINKENNNKVCNNNGAGINCENCCSHCCNNKNNGAVENENIEIPINNAMTQSNIFINEPIPIQSGINQTMNIPNNSVNPLSKTTTLNTILNESVFMEKFKIIDIRAMGSGAKKGHGFPTIVPNEISQLISQDEYSKFIKPFNRIYNYFYLLFISVAFLIGGILFPVFIIRVTSLLWAVIGGCSLIALSGIFYFCVNKYIKGKRISLLEKKVRNFNIKMDSISCPLQFCIMRVQEAVPGKPHFSVERLIIRITYSNDRVPVGNPES